MKKIILLLAAFFCLTNSYAQQRVKDSLKTLLKKEKRDTARVWLLTSLSNAYGANKPDTAMLLALEALSLSQRIGFVKGEAASLGYIGNFYRNVGNRPKAMEVTLKSLKLNEKSNNLRGIVTNFSNIGLIYFEQGEYHKSLDYLLKAKKLQEQLNLKGGNGILTVRLGRSYLGLKQYDSARFYAQQGYEAARKSNSLYGIGANFSLMGSIYSETGQKKLALEYYRRSIPYIKLAGNNGPLSSTFLLMAKLFENEGQMDSTLFYANRAFKISGGKFNIQVLDASKLLSSFYEKRGNTDSALFYLKIAAATNDSIFGKEKINQFMRLSFSEQMRQQEILKQQEQYDNRVKMYGLVAIVIVFLIIAIILWRNNRLQQKANEKIQKTLAELKTTQSQLIQSEKMASLGELTAGIAHEIQNPLNFVNNFSEVSIEMLDEMEQELTKGDKAEAIAIAADIKQNLEKIHHHGQRADGIVKGMLQHSRASSTTKEPTDINKLADEYLRLAYHGLRAKDKSFNAELETNFADNLPLINVVPQDIGRVLLNLFTNAFYATQQKVKNQGGDNYKPVVKIDTKINNRYIEITVSDNGTGIPEDIKEKVLQPFFTTKPTGEGTGLGLSLSYDIVVKGHNGKIEVNSEEGKYTAFKISIPA